jgi:hypothetical protein
MSVFPLDIGVVVGVTDEPLPSVPPTQTDTCFLLHSCSEVGSPTELTELRNTVQARTEFEGEAPILALADAFFAEGGARLYVAPLDDTAPDVTAGLAMIGPEHGPGQLVAPEAVTTPDQTELADWAWLTNRFYIADGPDGATDAALITLADALKAVDGGRFASLEADTLVIPGVASGQTREVPASIVVAALMARSDLATGNPNLAAAGVNGECRYVVGIAAERLHADRNALGVEQVNTFRTVNQRIRHYGNRTLADLETLPHWLDSSGSRVIMATRARELAVAESHAFGQIDGERKFFDQYEGALRGELAALARLGAFYGTTDAPGYRVDVSAEVNPIENIMQGVVTAQVVVRTSMFTESLRVNIIRRALNQQV